MEISAFAEMLLRSEKLANKVFFPEKGISAFTDVNPGNCSSVLDHLTEPGRPEALRLGRASTHKVDFPTAADLKNLSARGIVLHFFANHELLAMELMALALLRFPEAPEKFRLGIVQTIAEEQNHMRLYMERMQEYGVEFGAVPVNRFFWDLLKDMRTPLDYVTRMSMTFEQANLDFSKHYQQLFQELGDLPTADVLERVYREEIGHVKYGVTWFNRWREVQNQSDWDAYKDSLPYPMTPSRAKGIGFDRIGREAAGLSKDFIEQLFVYQHSKGRPPVVFFFNPQAEVEAFSQEKQVAEPAPVRDIRRDLGALMMFLSASGDVVIVDEKPSTEFQRSFIEAGLTLPQFATWSEIKGRTVTRFEPWGRTKQAASSAEKIAGRTTEGPIKVTPSHLFSKRWHAEHANSVFPSEVLITADDVKKAIDRHFKTSDQLLVLKAPFGSSGRNMTRVTPNGLGPNERKWIESMLALQGALIAEPWVHKVADLSVQIETSEAGTRVLGVTRFLTNGRGQYIGHYLGKKFSDMPQEFHRTYHEAGFESKLISSAQNIGTKLIAEGYYGPAGIDAFIWQDEQGSLKLRPTVEINPRFTMGRVALEIERRMLLHKSEALWLHLSTRTLEKKGLNSPLEAASKLRAQFGNDAFCTNDPATAKSILSILFRGPACAWARSNFI